MTTAKTPLPIINATVNFSIISFFLIVFFIVVL
jgi:hypothetical protein